MPRARTIPATDDETVIKKPRASRARVVSSNEEDKPAPRRRRVAEVAPEPTATSHSHLHDTGRKAPTALGDRHRKQTRNSRGLLVASVFCTVVIAFSLGVGILDHGVIDVVAVVNERNEKINRGEVRDASGQTITQTVSVQAPETRPNGGLILADVQPNATPATPPPIPETASSTATSTEPTPPTATTTASTTEAQ